MSANHFQDPNISHPDRLYNHLEKESIMTPEQRGGKKDCYGCKDQLMINNAIPGELQEKEEKPVYSLD